MCWLERVCEGGCAWERERDEQREREREVENVVAMMFQRRNKRK